MITTTIDRAVTTTLNIIRSYYPCVASWQKLLTGLGKTQADDEPLAFIRILEINGLDDALWALRCVDNQKELRLFAVACAREVQHLMTDSRSIAALDVAERHAHGQATDSELVAAGAAAGAVAEARLDAARDAAGAVAWAAAEAARNAAGAVAWAAAEAARNAARDAAGAAAGAVAEARWDAARAAAWIAMRKRQTELFVQFFGGEA